MNHEAPSMSALWGRGGRLRKLLALAFALVMLAAPADAFAGKDRGDGGKPGNGRLSNWTG